MQLRSYQQQAIAAVRSDWGEGTTDSLLIAATGAGKTQMFLRLLLDELDDAPNARALVLAHRRELIDQPLERVRQLEPAWLMRMNDLRPRVGVVQGERNDLDRALTIATVQSLVARGRADRTAGRYPRLEALLAHGPITHLVIDECHHATAESYLAVYRALKAANPDLRHLGVTATPLRADGVGLATLYQKDSARISIADLVKLGWLIPPRWLGISTNISIQGVQTQGGDFVQSQLARAFDTAQGRRIVVQAYQQYAAGRRAIAFTASVAGAHDLAAAFRAEGITAAAVDGATPSDERARILSAYKRGEITVLANCQVLTEGFDAPGTACVLMCRPTRSDSLYIQCMGRGLRPALGQAQPGEDCLVLDFLPAETRNIVLAGDVLGLPAAQVAAVHELAQQEAEEGAVQAGFTFDGETFDTGGTPLEIVARELSYFAQSPLVWHPAGPIADVRTVGLGKASDGSERILALRGGQLWGIARRDGGMWAARPIPCDDPYEQARAIADRYADPTLSYKDRGWRAAGLSEGQERYLRQLARGRMKSADIRLLTRGAAACWITHFQALDALARFDAGMQAGVVVENEALV